MKSFFIIIKSDYLQRTRSYAFLITLCASLAIAYTFVPEPNASYSTIRIGDYVGFYNSAWFGYVTAIMTSIFLSLIGFYLINSGIKKDIETKVGQIVATTPISNFKYLFSKVLSNFLVLLSITFLVFLMSLVLFFLYHDDFSFELFQFIKPYLIITLPALFFISVIAVIFEVLFGKYSVLQNVLFFILFSSLMVFTPKTDAAFPLDIFGSKIVIHELEETVRGITNAEKEMDLTIGYILSNAEQAKKFQFEGIDFPMSFILSRLLIFFLGVVLIALTSPFFHRFNIKEKSSNKKSKPIVEKTKINKEIILNSFPELRISYSISALFKTEFMLLVRKGKKWLWLFNVIGMILLAVLPLKLAHQMLLPILWFLQVSRLSDLTSKEITNNTHYFAFTSYKPIGRLLISQLLAGIALMILVALPLIIRLGLSSNFSNIPAIILGGILIVIFAVLLGILSKGKKLFEVLFFLITYANINRIPFLDYFGGLKHHPLFLVKLALLIFILAGISLLLRKYQLKK